LYRAVQIQNSLAYLSIRWADATLFDDDCCTSGSGTNSNRPAWAEAGEPTNTARAMHVVPSRMAFSLRAIEQIGLKHIFGLIGDSLNRLAAVYSLQNPNEAIR
jgi:hypothetical protein